MSDTLINSDELSAADAFRRAADLLLRAENAGDRELMVKFTEIARTYMLLGVEMADQGRAGAITVTELGAFEHAARVLHEAATTLDRSLMDNLDRIGTAWVRLAEAVALPVGS